MNKIDDLLLQLEHCVANNKYLPSAPYNLSVQGNNINAARISVNAFLNSDGGTVICGIEDNKTDNSYLFSGIDNSASYVDQLKATVFTSSKDAPKDVRNNIAYEIKHFLNGEVVIISIMSVPAEERYVHFERKAYIRTSESNKLMQDLSNIAESADTEDISDNTRKIYSAELISLFGPDYISLLPEFKQMLSFIYEQNNALEKTTPTPGEIGSKLWSTKGNDTSHRSYEQFLLLTKKALTLLEKSGFIVKGSKSGYTMNNRYAPVKSLFN